MESRRQNLRYYGIVALIALLSYLSSLWNEYAFDDLIHIQNNTGLYSWSALLTTILSPIFPGDLFRPTTVASNGLLILTFGSAPVYQHLLNIILHAANSLLLARAFNTIGLRSPFLMASVWATLPIHLETVANCTGRGELLAFFFGISALLVALNQAHLTILRGTALFISTALSFGAKESGCLWAIAIVLIAFFYQQTSKRVIILVVASGILVVCILRYLAFNGVYVTPSPSSLDNPLVAYPLYERIPIAYALLGRYALTSFTPISIAADYSWGYFLPKLSVPLVLGYALITTCLISCIPLSLTRKNYTTALGVVWFFFSFLLTSNLLFPIGTIFADRLTYSPSCGLILALGSIAVSQRSKRILVGFIVCYGLLQASNSPIWKNNVSLYMHQKSVSLQSAKTKVNLAVIERNQGHFTRAAKLLTAALTQYPEYAEAKFNLAHISFARGDMQKGYDFLSDALKINPEFPDALNLAGRLALNENRLSDAFGYFEKLIDGSPYSVDGHIGLLAIAINSGDTATAKKLLSRLDEIAPKNAEVAGLRSAISSDYAH